MSFYIHKLTGSTRKKAEMYLRSQFLHELKELVDVFRVLLPHVVGFLTTHDCKRLDGDFFSELCSQRAETSQHQSSTMTTANLGSTSRLSHHHNHKALWDYCSHENASLTIRLAAAGQRGETDNSLCLADESLAP